MTTAGPLVDGRFLLGCLAGPLAGGFIYSAVLGLVSASVETFLFYLVSAIVYGYMIGVAVLLPAFLLLRIKRWDTVWACAAIGLFAGLGFHAWLFQAPVRASETLSILLYGAMPFVAIALAVRLIAGRRV